MAFHRAGTFTQDQFQHFGLAGKDSPPVPTVPPPPYPSLSNIPVELEESNEQTYQLLWRERFLNDLRDSPYFIRIKEVVKPSLPLRYSELVELAKVKVVVKPEFKLKRMPFELRAPELRKRRNADGADKLVAKKMNTDIASKLEQLERKERTEGGESPKKADNAMLDTDDEERPVEDEENDEEENDYGNSYFDNGEDFNEEDDNIDDGPVY